MVREWALILSDYRREYQVSGEELARMSVHEFRALLAGLSDRSRFGRAWRDAPKHLYDPDEIAAVKAAARR